MFGILGGGGRSAEELQAQLSEREAEIADLQEKLSAFRDADQRDFLMDNSDQLTNVINTKNLVIQELQAQLQAQGKEGIAQALEAAATSASEVQRLRELADSLRAQLEASQAEVAQLQTTAAAKAPNAEPSIAAPGIEALEKQLQLYKAENERQAQELASSAVSHAMEVGRLQATLKAATSASSTEAAPSHAEQELRTTLNQTQATLSTLQADFARSKEESAAKEAQLEQAISSLAAKEGQSQQTITSLEGKIVALEGQLVEASSHQDAERISAEALAALQLELNSSRETALAREQEVRTSMETLAATQKELASSREETIAKGVEAQQTEAKLLELRAQNGAVVMQWKAALDAANERIQALEDEVAKVPEAKPQTSLTEPDNVVALEEAQQRLAETEARLAKQGQELEDELSRRDAAIADLQSRLHSVEAAEEKAPTATELDTIASLQEAGRRLAESEARVVEQAREFEKELARRDVVIVELQEELSKAATDRVPTPSTDIDTMAALEEARSQLAMSDARLADKALEFEGEIARRDTAIADLQSRLELAEVGQARAASAQVEAMERIAEATIEFEGEISKRDAAIVDLQSRLELAEVAKASATSLEVEAEFRHKYAELSAQHQSALEQVAKLQEEVLQRSASVLQPTAEEVSRQQQLDQREQQLQELAAALDRRLVEVETTAVAKAEIHGSSETADLEDLNAKLLKRVEELEAAKAETAQARLQARTATEETAEARRSVQEMTAKVQVLEAKLLRAKGDAQAAEQRAAGATAVAVKGDVSSSLSGVGSGSLSGLIAGALQDVETGERSCVTVSDLGLSDVAGLREVDSFLRLLSALMAVRADARLGVFGLWLICHFIYVVYLVYEHLIRR